MYAYVSLLRQIKKQNSNNYVKRILDIKIFGKRKRNSDKLSSFEKITSIYAEILHLQVSSCDAVLLENYLNHKFQ